MATMILYNVMDNLINALRAQEDLVDIEATYNTHMPNLSDSIIDDYLEEHALQDIVVDVTVGSDSILICLEKL